MPLPFVTDSLDSVAEPFRTEYTEKDGKFHLNVEGGEDTTALKKALAAERTANKTAKQDIDSWKKLGKTPDEIQEMLATKEAEAQEALKKAGKFDEVLNTKQAQWAKEKADSEAALKAERDAAISSERAAIVETRVTNALTAAKVTKEGLDLLTERLGRRIKFEVENGKRVTTIMNADGETPMVGSGKEGVATFDDLVKEAVKQYPSLFEGSGAGGGGKSPREGAGGSGKSMPRAEWDRLNPFEQAAKIKEGVRPVD